MSNLTMSSIRESKNHRLVTLSALLTTFVLILLSGCSSTNSSSSTASPNVASPLPSTQAPVPSSAAPIAGSTPPAAMATPPVQEHLIGMGSETVVTVHGKIVSVNRPKKTVTLDGPRGKQVTIHVYNPYNLEAAKAGAPFVAKFYEIVTIRKLLPGESLPAASLAEGIVSATPGLVPGAVAGTQAQMVVTIDSIDRDKKTVGVEGPDGSIETVSVANPANLKHVKVGDKIVVTLTNVVAIALEPESGN
jgi:hypothetical protein